jgi:hypothetical protein
MVSEESTLKGLDRLNASRGKTGRAVAWEMGS